jgi:hypothetical protein
MCQASINDVREGVLLPFDAIDIDRRVKLARARWPAGAREDGASRRACSRL